MQINILKKISLALLLGLGGIGIAYGAGNYIFGPATGTFYVGRQFEVNINMTTTQATTAADIEIYYDACKLTVVDALPAPGVQIYTGTVFPNYPANGNIVTVTGCLGNIQLTGFTTDSVGVLVGGGNGLFGKIRFKVRDTNLSGTLLDIRTDGFGPSFTLDSNISNVSGFDMLNAATDGNYELRADQNPVPDGDDRPFFGGFSPGLNASGVNVAANILFNTFDNESGVDLASITNTVTINGVVSNVYTTVSSAVIPSCVSSNLDAVSVCNLTIDPIQNFPYDALVCSTVSARDLSQSAITFAPTPNSAASITNCFRTLYDTVAPVTTNNVPVKNSNNIALATPFSFVVSDAESGVNINSVMVTIKSIDYTVAGPNTFTYTGTPASYTITIPTATLPNFVQNELVSARLRAEDIATQVGVAAPNTLDETYTFRIGDTLAPQVTATSPLANTQFSDLCTTPLVTTLEDSGSGVNINSVRVFVSATGLYYTKAGPNLFTNTGTSTAYTITIAPPATCWPGNIPIAVGVFARDIAGNYLDAHIFALGGSASSTVQTIINTVTNTVSVPGGNIGIPYNVVEYRDVIKEKTVMSTPEIIEKILYLYKVQPTVAEKKAIYQKVEVALENLANAGTKASLVGINNKTITNNKYWFFESSALRLRGNGVPLSTLEIEVTELQAKSYVTVGGDGTWQTVIPNKLRGYAVYNITAQASDGVTTYGIKNKITEVTIVPWWWILVLLLGVLLVTLVYRIKTIKKA